VTRVDGVHRARAEACEASLAVDVHDGTPSATGSGRTGRAGDAAVQVDRHASCGGARDRVQGLVSSRGWNARPGRRCGLVETRIFRARRPLHTATARRTRPRRGGPRISRARRPGARAAAGSVELTMSPELSTATQSDCEGHEIPDRKAPVSRPERTREPSMPSREKTCQAPDRPSGSRTRRRRPPGRPPCTETPTRTKRRTGSCTVHVDRDPRRRRATRVGDSTTFRGCRLRRREPWTGRTHS